MLEVKLSLNQANPYPRTFLCVMIVICALAMQYACTMYLLTMSARIKAYTKEFMSQFSEDHA